MPNLVRLKRAFGWGSGHTRPYGWPGEITSVTTLTLAPTTTTTQPPAQPPQTQTATVTTAIVVTSPVVVTTSPEPPSTSSTPASSPTDTSSESGSPRSTTSRSSGRSFSSSTSRSNRASPTSVADHAPSESPASETVIYHTVSGTVTQTVASVASGPTIVAADTTASQPRSMNAGEKAAIAIACIFVFLLPVVIFCMWRKKKSQREHQRIHSPTHTISGGMIYIGPRGANGAMRDTIGSQGATIHSLSIGSSRFSTSDDGHAAVVAAAAYPDEKSPSAFASSSGDARSASLRPSSPLLSPRSSVPLISPVSPMSPMSPMVSMAHMSQIMPYDYAPGPPPLAHTHMAQLSPVPPMPNFPFITSPTTAATERLPYAWDNPPPSSEYLPGSTSRRSTFRTSRYANRDLTSGFPSPPYGSALPEDARSERSAPPMYSRD